MKKRICTVLLFLIAAFIFSDETQDRVSKRTALILPFINKNNVAKYDYLQDSLLNALTTELIKTNKFNFVNQVELEELLSEQEKKIIYYDKIKSALNIASKLKADTVVAGQYVIIEDKILIQIKAVDIFTGQIVGSTNMNGELGIDIFRIIDESSKDISIKMVEKLEIINEKYFEKIKELKNNLTALNKAGIIFSAVGGAFFITGVPILIYDLAGYSIVLNEAKNKYENDEITYDENYSSYQTFIGLFCSGITLSAIGLSLISVGIPLSIYKSKNKNVSLEISSGQITKVSVKIDF